MFKLEDKDSPRVIPKIPYSIRFSLLSEFKESFLSYIYDRKVLISYYIFRVKKISKKVNLAKSNIYQKFYWGRGSLYKPSLMFLILFMFMFSFSMVWLSSGNQKQVKVQKLNLSTASRSVLTDETSLPSNVTSSKITSGYGLINWYKVKPGDTLQSIASKFNISASVLAWSNNIKNNDIYTGEALNIIPVSGITYTVKAGDTLQSIASKYQTTVSQIQDWNLLNNANIMASSLPSGETIFIPNAVIPSQSPNYSYAVNYTRSFASLSSSNPTSFYFSQGNPAWAGVRLGYSGYNISEVGCLITDIAMVGKFYGYNITPQSIASNPANFDGPLYNWNGLGIFNVTPLGSLFGGYVNWNEINTSLAQNHPVVVSIDYDYHYVLLTSRLSNGEYVMNDPARGSGLIFNNYYSTSTVTQAVLFTPR